MFIMLVVKRGFYILPNIKMSKIKKMFEGLSTLRNAKKFGRPFEKQAFRDWVVRLLNEWKKSWKSDEELAKILSDEQWKIEYAEAFMATWRKMNKEMAEKLIQSWNRKYVEENLTKIKWVDDVLLKELWEAGREMYLSKVYDSIKEDSFSFIYDNDIFKFITQHELADIMVYTSNYMTGRYGQIDKLAEYFYKFPLLDPLEYAKKIEAQVGRKYYFYAPWAEMDLVNPIRELIFNCKEITPEFEKYIISLWRDFQYLLDKRREREQRNDTWKNAEKNTEETFKMAVDKSDLLSEYIKSSKSMLWILEFEEHELTWDDAEIHDDLYGDIIWKGKDEMERTERMRKFFASVNESDRY